MSKYVRSFEVLNTRTLNRLSGAVTEFINAPYKRNVIAHTINGMLNRKSIKNVMLDLKRYIQTVQGQLKNEAVLLSVLSLLCRDPECSNEIKPYIQELNLTNHLYGGLAKLLSGQSEFFSVQISWNDYHFRNKYEFLTRFSFWDKCRACSIIIQAAKILKQADVSKYEQLLINDKSYLLLLNMIDCSSDTDPSDGLIQKLLTSDDELKQNVGLLFISNRVEQPMNKLITINRYAENRGATDKKIRSYKKAFNVAADAFLEKIELCNRETQASLLFNYLLVNEMYPDVYAKKLLGPLQPEFVKQINSSGKIKNVRDLTLVTYIIVKTPATNEKNIRIAKANLFLTVTGVLIQLFEERRVFDDDSENIKKICSVLPVKCKQKLRRYLTKKKTELMCEEIDRLIRFSTYLNDKRLSQLVDEVLKCIEAQLKSN